MFGEEVAGELGGGDGPVCGLPVPMWHCAMHLVHLHTVQHCHDKGCIQSSLQQELQNSSRRSSNTVMTKGAYTLLVESPVDYQACP